MVDGAVAPAALALIAAFAIGTSDYLYRAAGGGSDPRRWMLVQSLSFAAVVAPVAIADGARFTPAALYGLANGPINLLGFFCVLRALSQGDALALAPVARLNFVVTAALTVWLLGEALTPARVLGLALATCAVLLVGGHYARIGGNWRALGFALGAMFASGIAGLLFKLGLAAGATPVELVGAQAAAFVACSTLAAWRSRGAAASRTATGAALACGALVAIFYLAIATAFVRADAVIIAPIAQLGFVLTALLAIWRLGERLTPARAGALALATCAVASLASA